MGHKLTGDIQFPKATGQKWKIECNNFNIQLQNMSHKAFSHCFHTTEALMKDKIKCLYQQVLFINFL